MNSRAHIKQLGIALALTIICIPFALIITIFSAPFWLLFENTFPIESIGPSGPAEWCYLAV